MQWLRPALLLGLLLLSACKQTAAPALTDATGQPLATNHWLLINYWATWCKPCRHEIPEFNTLHQQLAEQPLLVLGYNFDQLEGDALLSASKQLDIQFPLLSNNSLHQLELPAVSGIPVTFLVNPQGQLIARLTGEQTRDSLMQALHQHGVLQQ